MNRRSWLTENNVREQRSRSRGTSVFFACRSRRRGLSLIELLLVLAILVAVAALAAPTLTGPLENHRLRKSGDLLRSAWGRTRIRAMEEGRVYMFRYQQNGNQYQSQPWMGGGDFELSAFELQEVNDLTAPVVSGASGAQAELAVKQLPDDVTFAGGELEADIRALLIEDELGVAATSGWSRPIMFHPDGTSSDARVVLTNKRNRFVVLQLRGLTGIANVSDLLSQQEMAYQ